MPDIKTALSQALKEWEPEQESNTKEKQMQTTAPKDTGFRIINNVSRKSYEFVVANPGVKPKDITEWAKKNGFNPDSAYAIASNSVRMGTMRRDANGGFVALAREYSPIKAKSKKTGVIPSAPKAPKAPKPVLNEPKAVATTKLTAKYIVDNIGIGEAKALYLELTQIFGA
jgi:hypothetical protein